MTAAASFHFNLFGPFRLVVDGAPVALPPQPAALLAFLILNRQRRVTREEVQALFWPEAEPARAQERLRRALYLLRRALEPHDLIAAEGNELTIAPDAALTVDYDDFERLLMDAHRTDPPMRAPLQAAVDLYTDDLLTDLYADWALLEREHARQRLLIALRHLLAICQTAGDWPALITTAYRLLELDPLQEVAHRALMTAHAATGDRSAALRVYRGCVDLLRDELGAEPLPETTQLYEAILAGDAVQRPPAVEPPPAHPGADLPPLPLVGRSDELAAIAAEWAICQRGHSRLVLVTGPAGVGKSRLVQEAAAQLPGPDVTILTGKCYAMEAGTPYQLIAEVVQGALAYVPVPLDEVTHADLAQLLPAAPVAAGAAPVMRPASPPDASVRLQEAVTTVLRHLAAAGGGLWLIAEDLHWADPASLACLNHALRRCDDLPFLVLATLRDEELPFDSPLMDWPAHSVHAPAPTTHIPLRRLPPDDVRALLAQVTDEADSARLLAFLDRETAGNPFFMVETLRALIDRGVLEAANNGDRWSLTERLPLEGEALPISEVVAQTIRGRVRRLSRTAQEVLTIAAVLEHDLDEWLLAALVDPALALDLALDELLRASILQEVEPGRYEFAHIKVREIIYADTSAPRRRFLHRRAADALAARGDPSSLAEIARLAYHYRRAHAWTDALHYEWRAAQTAYLAGALAEANRYAENVIAILDEQGRALDRARLPAPLEVIRFDALALRADFRRLAATAGLHYPPDLIAALDDLAPHVDEARQARAALMQATHRLGQGDLSGARAAAEQGHALYASLDDAWGQADAVQHAIEIAYRAGDIVAMIGLLDKLRALSAASDVPEVRRALARNEMRLAVYRGNWLDVLRLAQTLGSEDHARLDPATAWLPLANIGLASMKLGAYDAAYDLARQAVQASEETGVLGLGARVLLAQLELARGAPELAREMLLDLLVAPDPLIGEAEVVAPALALVRCCVALNDVDEARTWAQRAAEAVSRVRLPILYPLSQVAWTLAYLVADRYEDAHKRLLYPLEFIMLLEDTSPQEIYTLRAAAARGLGNDEAARDWLRRAQDTLDEQAAAIEDAAYRASFFENVPLHRFIRRAAQGAPWDPRDVLHLPLAGAP